MLNAQIQIEARLFKSFWDDGLLDLLCGIALLAVGIGWGLDYVLMAAIVPPILTSLWAPLRRALVEPRAGYVEFSQTRQSKTQGGLKMVFILCTGTFLLGVVTFLYLQTTENAETIGGLAYVISGLPALLLAVGALIVAQLIETRRFGAYAVLLIFLALTTIVLQLGPAMPMLVSGIAVTLSGAILMVRFLRASVDFEGDV